MQFLFYIFVKLPLKIITTPKSDIVAKRWETPADIPESFHGELKILNE